VTPLSRRNYNSSGLIIEDLAPQRNATIQVARSNGIDFIDLNAASTKYLDSIGKAKAVTYNRIPTDFTHLNAVGSVVFGDMVSWLMTTTTSYADDIKPFTKPNATIVGDIKNGVYVYPAS
jgi:hypothetical protein